MFKRIIDNDPETGQVGMACTDFTRLTVIMRTPVDAIAVWGKMFSLKCMGGWGVAMIVKVL